jgi:hypothetical protein
MALPTNQEFDERAVILQLSLAVKDFGRFWLKNTVTIYRRELRNSGRCRAQFGLELWNMKNPMDAGLKWEIELISNLPNLAEDWKWPIEEGSQLKGTPVGNQGLAIRLEPQVDLLPDLKFSLCSLQV